MVKEPTAMNSVPLTGYTGHLQTEPTGLIYMRGRFYSPAWHRFMNSDQGVDPNSINQFGYVCGSPLMSTDPSGMIISSMNHDDAVAAKADRDKRSREAAKAWGDQAMKDPKMENVDIDPESFADAAVNDPCFLVKDYKTISKDYLGWKAGVDNAVHLGQALVGLAVALPDMINLVRSVTNFFRQTTTSVSPVTIDPNKLTHIFGKAAHSLGPVVSQFGTEEAAYSALKTATEAAVKAQGMAGTFETAVDVGGNLVTVRGAVVDGAVKIGTAFIP